MKGLTRVLTPLAAALLIAGCGSGNDTASNSSSVAPTQALKVVSPAPESAYSSTPAEFAIVLPAGFSAEDVVVDLNDADVSRVFAVRASGSGVNFTAKGADLSALLKPGENVLWVKAGGKYQRISFFIDTQAPELHVLNVDPVTSSVSGYLIEPSGTQSFTLNGNAVTLQSDGTFSATYADQEFNTFAATDTLGHSMSVTYADSSASDLGLRLNQSVFNQLSPLIVDQFNSLDLNALVSQFGTFNVSNTALTKLDMQITGAQIGSPAVDLSVLGSEQLRASLSLDDIVIGFRLSGTSNFLPIDTSGTIEFNQLDSQTFINLSLDQGELAGGLSATQIALGEPTVDIQSTGLISGLINLITEPMYAIAISSVKPQLQTALAAAVEQSVNPAFDKVVDLLSFDSAAQTDSNYAIRVAPTLLNFKNLGLNLGLGAQVTSTLPSNAPNSLGYIYKSESAIDLGANAPSGASYDVTASFSANVLNQALFQINATQLSNQTYEFPLSQLSGNLTSSASSDDPSTEDQLRIKLNPLSAPYVVLGSSNGATGKLIWRDVDLGLDLYKQRWGEFKPMLDLRTDLEVDFDLSLSAQNQITLKLASLPKVDVTQSRQAGSFKLSAKLIDFFANYAVQRSLPNLESQMQVIDLPLEGSGFTLNEIWTAGAQNNTVVLAGNLE